jgi:hypothetical protein
MRSASLICLEYKLLSGSQMQHIFKKQIKDKNCKGRDCENVSPISDMDGSFSG